MNTPSYVMHDGKRWYVIGPVDIDGAPGYELRDVRGRCIIARAAECEPWQRPLETLRLFRAGKHVLEIHVHGCEVRRVYVRTARSSKRWPTSIDAIHSMTVKAAIALEKAKKKAARRGRGRR
jgi:hypothetical protein